MAQVITEAEFREKVLEADVPVMVDFFATWCGPCKAMAPTIDELEEHMAGYAHVYKMDAEECMDIATEYRIMSVPTVVVFENGQLKSREVGQKSKQELLDMFL